MGLVEYFDNLRYALTGKKRDRSGEWRRLAKDLVFPAVLTPRDKHGHRDAAFFRNAIEYAIGYTRLSLSEDRAHGEHAVQRVYLVQAAQGYVQFLMLAYAGGLAFDQMQRIVPEMLDAIAYCDPQYQKVAYLEEHNHILDLTPFYFSAFPALAILIALRRTKRELMQLLSATGKPGQDQLFDRVVQRIDITRIVGGKIKISPHYGLLIKAMDAPSAEQGHLLIKFLDGWYKKVCKHSSGYDTHASEAYDGYFSYEAAAVVMLWDIDDSAFRDHPYYPDALVDYYRKTGSQGI